MALNRQNWTSFFLRATLVLKLVSIILILEGERGYKGGLDLKPVFCSDPKYTYSRSAPTMYWRLLKAIFISSIYLEFYIIVINICMYSYPVISAQVKYIWGKNCSQIKTLSLNQDQLQPNLTLIKLLWYCSDYNYFYYN